MTGTREGGKESRKYSEEDTAFCGLQGGELSVCAKDFSDSFFKGWPEKIHVGQRAARIITSASGSAAPGPQEGSEGRRL